MNRATLGAADLRHILMYAADQIRTEEAALNALDAAVGDGDHGITMRLGFEAVKEKLGQMDDSATLSSVLEEAGQAFMGVTGGAIGIILARILIGGAGPLRGRAELGAPEFRAMLAAMDAAVSAGGKVKPGDKTILDAVHAAAEAVDPDQGLAQAFTAAAAAATEGAEKTAGMLCRVGRGSRLGDRTLGHRDPGAVSFSIILRCFADCPTGE